MGSAGGWAFSLGRPKPRRKQGTLKVSYIWVTKGMEPPSRMKTAFLPKPFCSATCALAKMGSLNGAAQGLPELRSSNLQVTAFGKSLRTCFSTILAIFCGSWLGTSRVENFAQALEGITVLAPSPV